MSYSTIGGLFKGICDAIRAKGVTTGLINHQDIPDLIESIGDDEPQNKVNKLAFNKVNIGNITFSDNENGTVNISANIVSASGYEGFAIPLKTLVVGKTYKISLKEISDISATQSSTYAKYWGIKLISDETITTQQTADYLFATSSGVETNIEFTFTATEPIQFILFSLAYTASNCTVNISDFSCIEI